MYDLVRRASAFGAVGTETAECAGGTACERKLCL